MIKMLTKLDLISIFFCVIFLVLSLNYPLFGICYGVLAIIIFGLRKDKFNLFRFVCFAIGVIKLII